VSRGEGIRAWVAGRHEVHALVEVDPVRAAPLGGRPVRGTTCAEITRVGYGSRTSARLDAATEMRRLIEALSVTGPVAVAGTCTAACVRRTGSLLRATL
jgi:hypothetical protein